MTCSWASERSLDCWDCCLSLSWRWETSCWWDLTISDTSDCLCGLWRGVSVYESCNLVGLLALAGSLLVFNRLVYDYLILDFAFSSPKCILSLIISASFSLAEMWRSSINFLIELISWVRPYVVLLISSISNCCICLSLALLCVWRGCWGAKNVCCLVWFECWSSCPNWVGGAPMGFIACFNDIND